MAGNFRGDESRPQTSEPSTESRKRSNHWIWAGRRPANVNNQPAIIAPSLCYGWYGSKCLPNYPAGVLQMSKRLAISSCVREGAIPIHLHVSPFSQGKVDFHWIFMGFYWCLWIFPGFPYIFRCPKKKVLALLGLHLCVPRPSHFSDLRFARAVATDLLLPGCWLLARLQEPSTISSTNSMQ